MYALFYEYVENIVERRAPFRDQHLALCKEWKPELVMGGAVGDPPHGALIVFEVEDATEVEAFVEADPYMQNGLVTEHRVVPWNVVV